MGFLSGLQRFGIGRLAALLGVAAGAAAVLVALMLRGGAEPNGLLYANLDLKEAAEITAALDQAGIKYEAKGDGSTIMAPRDQVASTRLMLSSKGLPTSGSVGYEIFDNTNALGQTDFVQNLNRQRALEGELARTIRSLKGVTSARVHLVMPKRQLFEEEAAAPTASVVVGVGGRDLGADQVRAVRNLVAGAVPNLKPDHVTLVDESGKMLAAGAEGDQAGLGSELAAGRKAEMEERVRRAVKDVVEGVVGAGKARVQVSAELDQTRITEQREIYDPDGQVIRSTTAVEETEGSTSSGVGGEASASSNLPGGAGAAGGGSEGSTAGRTEETTNYEISKTVRTEVIEPGAVKRLSVAVAVDGVTTTAKDGKTSYAPRSTEEMQRIEQLVRSAVGADQARGDQVSVVNVRFNREADGVGGTPAAAPLMDFDKNDIMRGVELAILLVVAALIVFFVIRPLLKSASGGPAGVPMLAGAGGGALPPGAQAQAIGYDPQSGASLALPGPSEMDQRLDIARIEGQVKASAVKKVADFVDKHPEESVSILRGWLHS